MADLEEILARLTQQVDGCVAAAVAGMDGLVIEQYPREGSDLTAAVAELTQALGGLRATVGNALDGGAVHEVIVTAERRTGYARLLEGELFCLLVLGRHGNVGKARLYSAEAERKIIGVLA